MAVFAPKLNISLIVSLDPIITAMKENDSLKYYWK